MRYRLAVVSVLDGKWEACEDVWRRSGDVEERQALSKTLSVEPGAKPKRKKLVMLPTSVRALVSLIKGQLTTDGKKVVKKNTLHTLDSASFIKTGNVTANYNIRNCSAEELGLKTALR